MKTNLMPTFQYYSNQDTEDQYCIDNYDRVKEELDETKDKLKKLKKSKYEEIYKEVAEKVNLDVKEFELMKRSMANYGKMFTEVFIKMKERGFTKKDFLEIDKKYGLATSYLFND